MPERLTVHLIDRDDDTRHALAFLLRMSGARVQEYDSIASFLRLAKNAVAGCVLLDIRAGGSAEAASMDALNRLCVRFPMIGIVSGVGAMPAVEATLSGAMRYLHRPIDKETLLDAIQAAFGQLARIDDDSRDQHDAQLKLASLTPREKDVFRALTLGQSNKVMAIELGISSRTAEIHRARVMTKLNARSLSEALQIAFSARVT